MKNVILVPAMAVGVKNGNKDNVVEESRSREV